jgi:CheY-like chemotaxis protein
VPSPPVVLCIDDNVAGLSTRKLLLEAKGFQVVTAESGRAGIAAANTHDVDVIILDYMMPDMDGEEVAKVLRETHPEVPIFLLSGYPEDLPQSLVHLVQGVFVKGGPLNAIIAELERLTGLQAKPPIDQSITLEENRRALSRAEELLRESTELRRKLDGRRKG